MCVHSPIDHLTPEETKTFVGKKVPVNYKKRKGRVVIDERKHLVKIRLNSGGFPCVLIDGEIRLVSLFEIKGADHNVEGAVL